MKFKIKYKEFWNKNKIIDKEDSIEANSEEDAIDCICFGSECSNIKIIECIPESEDSKDE